MHLEVETQCLQNSEQDIETHRGLSVLYTVDRPHGDVRDHGKCSLVEALAAPLVTNAFTNTFRRRGFHLHDHAYLIGFSHLGALSV